PLRVFDEQVGGTAQAAERLQQAKLPTLTAVWRDDGFVRLTTSRDDVAEVAARLRLIRDAVGAQLEVDQPYAASSAFTVIRVGEHLEAWDRQMTPGAVRGRRNSGYEHATEFAAKHASSAEMFGKLLELNQSSETWITLSAHDSPFGRELLARVV